MRYDRNSVHAIHVVPKPKSLDAPFLDTWRRAILLSLTAGFAMLCLGCSDLTGTAASKHLVGRWKGSIDSIRFLAGGKYYQYAMIKTNEGRWKLADDGRLVITMDSWYMPDVDFAFRLEGDRLTLTSLTNNLQLVYERVPE